MIITLNPDWRICGGDTLWRVERYWFTPGLGDRVAAVQDGWYKQGEFKTLSAALEQAVEWQLMSMDGEYGPEAIKPLQTALEAFKNNIAGLVKDLK